MIRARSEVTDLALIKGSASRIPIYVRSWHKKRNPAFMAVVSSTFLEMAGEDFAKAAREAESTVPCPVAYVKTLGFDGDLYDGYNSLALEVLRRVPFKKTKPVPGRVGVVGYVFDRYEMDHAGNLQQLRFLLESLGLECGPVVLSGRPYKELMGLASCERLILLHYGRVYAKELSKLSGRPVIQTDLPVGLSGTFRWLQDVAKGCGVAKPVVEACIKRQSDYARPQMDSLRTYARQRLGSRRIALFAETPLAAGLASFAAEAGLSPALVGLRDRSLGGRKAFLEAVGRTGVKPPEDLEVLENPSLSLSVQKVSALRDRGQLSLVVGSCTELSYINPEGRQNEVPSVELGFPSFNYHVLFPTPYYGVAGALALAQRVMNQVR